MERINTQSKMNIRYSVKSALLLTSLVLSGCGSSSDDASKNSTPQLSTFNLTAINAANTNSNDGAATVRTMQLTWNSGLSDASLTGVDYTVCQVDDSQTNNCLALTSVTDTLSAMVEINLLDALSQDYFVLADYEDETKASSELSLESETLTEMIGYFKASNTEGGLYYGQAVALSADGQTLAVSAKRESSAATGIDGEQAYDADAETNYVSASGAVYIYSKSDGGWSQTAYVKASNGEKSDFFGQAVALSADGSKLVVSANGEDSDGSDEANNGASSSGAVYTFELTSGTWSQTDYLKASNAEKSDGFGWSLTLSNDGNTLAVGANGEDSNTTGINGDQTDNSVSGSGAVYIFNDSDSSWSQAAYVKASNAEKTDNFGYSVALNEDGSTLVVGATGEDSATTGINGLQTESKDEDTNYASGSGAVYVFKLNNSVWAQSDYIKASNTEASDNFGYSVSISDDGNTIAVGAYGEDSATTGIDGVETESKDEDSNYASTAGAAYLFNFDGTDWSQTAYLKPSNTQEKWYFGFNLSLSGDGNILAVGAYRENSLSSGINGDQASDEDSNNNFAEYAGAAYLFTLADSIWEQSAYIKSSTPEEKDYFAAALALDHDGDTLAVGAYGEDSAATGINGDQTDNTADSYAGAVYLY